MPAYEDSGGDARAAKPRCYMRRAHTRQESARQSRLRYLLCRRCLPRGACRAPVVDGTPAGDMLIIAYA